MKSISRIFIKFDLEKLIDYIAGFLNFKFMECT